MTDLPDAIYTNGLNDATDALHVDSAEAHELELTHWTRTDLYFNRAELERLERGLRLGPDEIYLNELDVKLYRKIIALLQVIK